MKKGILILSLLIFIISISCVSASDNLNTTDTLTLDDNVDNALLEDNVQDTLTLDDNNDAVLSDLGTSKELQRIIDNADEYDNIHLTKDYELDEEIIIDKYLFIDGGEHFIRGDGSSRLFYISAESSLIANLTFVDGYANEDYGGAIYADYNVMLSKCNFGFNYAVAGGAIYAYNAITAYDCIFLENYASEAGGAILASEVSADYCHFLNNTADYYASAILADNLLMQFCEFSSEDNMEFVFINNWEESVDTHVHLHENYMSNSAPYDIIYIGYGMITSQINVILNNQTVKQGQEIEIGTVEDDYGNTIGTDIVEVEISDKNGKVVDTFMMDLLNGYYYECNLDPGVYTVNAAISSYRAPVVNVKKGTLTVTAPAPDKIELKASDVTKYYKGDEVYTVTAYNNGKPVSGVNISIVISNVEYTRTTNDNGVAKLNLNYPSGTYEITSSYKGKKVTSKVTIKPTITGNDVTGTTQSTKYSVTVLNSDGTPLKNTKVSFKIGTDTQSATTNDKGVATVNLKLKAGSYQIEATNPKTSEKIKNSITVKNPPASVKIEAKDFTKYYGGTERFTVKITDTNGKALANKEVKITINGNTYPKTTDSNGIAGMNIGLNSKVYPTTVECDGQTVDVKVTVKPTVAGNDITKMYKNDTQYYATFYDSQGNVLKNTDVNFNINGVFYTRTTDANGKARMNINLNPNTYVITAQNPKTNEKFTNKITVKPTIVENHDLTKYYKNASRYTLRLLGNNGKPVGAGVTVELNINGVIYKKQSDANGYVGMNINLPPSTYVVTATYNGLRASNTIKVLNIISGKDLNMEYRDGSKYEVKLLDGKGKPYAGQTVRLNINGVFYNKVTDSNGIARLTINLPVGTYTITASYNGLNTANTIKIRTEATKIHKADGFTFEIPKSHSVESEKIFDSNGNSYAEYSTLGNDIDYAIEFYTNFVLGGKHMYTPHGWQQNNWYLFTYKNVYKYIHGRNSGSIISLETTNPNSVQTILSSLKLDPSSTEEFKKITRSSYSIVIPGDAVVSGDSSETNVTYSNGETARIIDSQKDSDYINGYFSDNDIPVMERYKNYNIYDLYWEYDFVGDKESNGHNYFITGTDLELTKSLIDKFKAI